MKKLDTQMIVKALTSLSRQELNTIANQKITKAMTQQELLLKTAITTADIAVAGKLTPAQADKYLDYVFDQTRTQNVVTTKKFRNDEMYFEIIDNFQRVSVAYEEATDPLYRSGVSHTRIPIKPEIVIATGKISDDYILENLEGQTVIDVVLMQLAKRFKNNLEELYLTGNKLGYARRESEIRQGGSPTDIRLDNFLAISNGWFTQGVAGEVYDALGNTDLVNVLVNMFRLMPNEFKTPRERLCWMLDPTTWAAYEYLLTLRGNGALGMLGQQSLEGNLGQHNPFSIKPMELPLLPQFPLNVEHVQLTGTTPVQLEHFNIQAGSGIVAPTTLGATPIAAPFTEGAGADYVIDYVNGTIARTGTSTIGDGDTVKFTYRTPPQIMLTDPKNLLLGIGYDITVERDRNVYELTNEFVMHTKVDVNVAQPRQIVMGHNVSPDLYVSP